MIYQNDWSILKNKERDKYLSEMMEIIWHKFEYLKDGWVCHTCEQEDSDDGPSIIFHKNIKENWKGTNWLGEVLTKLRDDLHEK